MQKIPHATPETAYQLYVVDVATHGQRGAYARVGRQLGKSDETIRRWIHQHDAETSAPDDLAYVDPPGAYPRPVPLPQPATESPQDATSATDDARDIIPLMSADDSPQCPTSLEPHATIAIRERPRVVRRPIPQPIPWWQTIEVHPQAIAVIVAVVLILVSFPH